MDGEATRSGNDSAESLIAWQCIGCGRIESPETCIGVCQYRRVDLVHAAEHQETRTALEAAKRERDALLAFVRTLAFSRPRAGEWECSYRALQARARSLVTRSGGTATRAHDAAA